MITHTGYRQIFAESGLSKPRVKQSQGHGEQGGNDADLSKGWHWHRHVALFSARRVTKSLAISVGKQGLSNPIIQLCVMDPAPEQSQQKGKLQPLALYKQSVNSKQFEFFLSPVTFR